MMHLKNSFSIGVLLSAALLAPCAPAYAQRGGGQYRDTPPRTNPLFLKAFEDVAKGAADCTVRVLCDDKEAALGTIVDPDGWILTKFSQLTTKPVCKLKSGSKLDAKIVGVHEAFDLALLKVEATDLHPADFTDSKVAPVGSWLVSVGTGDQPAAVGVMSVAARTPPPVTMRGPGRGGNGPPSGPDLLGVNVASDGITARVMLVAGQSAAAKAGVKVDDQILSIDGKEITDQRSLLALLARMKAGDSIAINILRDGTELELKAKLQPAATPGYLGVSVTSNGTTAKVVEVARRSAAERAGIKTDDLIVSIEGSAVSDQKTLLSILGKKQPGDTVKIKVLRDGKELPLEARLQQRGQQRPDQNQMGSKLSEKRSGFPTYFQSDMVIKPEDCGGPVCDLDGHVIGISIARAGRVESFAIPSASITALLPELKSGKLSPELLALRKKIATLKVAVKRATDEEAAADKNGSDDEESPKKPLANLAELDKKLRAAQLEMEKIEKELSEKK